jgi:arylsulfatase A-like enzyme
VLIVIDTLRADALGAYGQPLATSPELDALAERGVRFARVVAQAPWTRPSVGSLLTSVHPRRLGIYSAWDDELADRFETVAEIMKRNGYTTIGATANPNVSRVFNFDQGFDHYLDSEVLSAGMVGRLEAPEKRPPLPTAHDVYKKVLGLVQEGRARPPFYLQLVVMDVHEHGDPRVRRPEFAGPFPGQGPRGYLQAVRQVSSDTGSFIDALRALPGLTETLFVVTSDHGEGLLDHPHVENSQTHGLLLYESHVLVPLILFDGGRRLPAGLVVKRSVRLLDVLPTVLDYVGLESSGPLEGASLLPLLGGDVGELPDLFVTETHFLGHHKLAVHSDQWNYIESRDGHRGTAPLELQPAHAPADGERTSLAAAHPDEVRRLAAFLSTWEAQNPPAPPARRRRPLVPAEAEQLRALGYVE